MTKHNLLLTAAALALAGTLTAYVIDVPSMAQSNPGDDDGDEDDDDDGDGDDDAGVPDPDDPDTDPPGDDDGDPGSGDADDDGPGGDDGGGAGGDDGGTDDGGDSDDGAAAGGGSAGGDDDDSESDDDDGAPAAAASGGGGDDDGDDDGDDGDDDDAPAASNGAGGDDDDDNGGGGDDDGPTENAPGNSGGDAGDDDDAVLEIIGGGSESESERLRLDERDGIDTDREGFRYRAHEFVAIDLQPTELAELRRRGIEVVRSSRLGALTGTLYLLRGPASANDQDLLGQIDDVADPGALSLNHLFDSTSARVRTQGKAPPVARPACGCRIGLIDTGVASSLPAFRHVQVEQRAFNAAAPVPQLHGTAIGHLFAGTAAKPGARTRIHVADIFAGPRGTAGSTYALVQALDWMAAQGVPVINVSLAGPRNAVVAASIDRLTSKGHVIVAAAGNDGPAAPPVFPGAYTGVIAVTAVDQRRQIYRYANRGSYVDFAARGVNVPSMDPKGLRTSTTGTSFAAPVIAARLAAALTRPNVAAAKAAVAALEASATDLGAPGRDATFGQGLVEEAP